MKITLLEIAGLSTFVEAMRAAKNSPSDSKRGNLLSYDNLKVETESIFELGCKDKTLSQALISFGDDHAKSVRSIVTWVSIEAKGHFFDQWGTYRHGVEPLGSTSTMHGRNKNLTGIEIDADREAFFGSYDYRRYFTVSYQAWRRIYYAREHHKLPGWAVVREFIAGLPLASELIIVDKCKKEVF